MTKKPKIGEKIRERIQYLIQCDRPHHPKLLFQNSILKKLFSKQYIIFYFKNTFENYFAQP